MFVVNTTIHHHHNHEIASRQITHLPIRPSPTFCMEPQSAQSKASLARCFTIESHGVKNLRLKTRCIHSHVSWQQLRQRDQLRMPTFRSHRAGAVGVAATLVNAESTNFLIASRVGKPSTLLQSETINTETVFSES